MFRVRDSEILKTIHSPVYNMVFRKYHSYSGREMKSGLTPYPEPDIGEDWVEDGGMLRFGVNLKDDPPMAPAPEIADIEISAGRCCGIRNKNGSFQGCQYCYKDNSPGRPIQNMDFDTYKKVLDLLAGPGILTQVALGITGVQDNPDFLRIMKYTRDLGIHPNFTLTGADLDYEMAYQLADLCGALAVSCSPTNPDLCFDTVKLFSGLGVGQVNIHIVVAEETLPFVREVMQARQEDPRLKDLNAIVGLMVKPKGRAKKTFLPPTMSQYQELVKEALDSRVPFGMDSCSCPHFIDSLDSIDLTEEEKQKMIQNSDPCESMCFSIYVNVEGKVYPCSFCEGEEGFEPIDLLATENFLQDVWYSEAANKFRQKLWENGRRCPAFPEVARLR